MFKFIKAEIANAEKKAEGPSSCALLVVGFIKKTERKISVTILCFIVIQLNYKIFLFIILYPYLLLDK